ncbi:restriction endonuclease subunit S [Nocardia asteroides]|uniref:restriction endonuclease subunit S n=1 Tax=Nocardia asteroides TaxID=1824 RepID=UPI001E43837F|nr:restriction endonuclease subunit S [Nocardia asteroides]UGT53961.1 restriction endonuclease subunit S [Nocardia asteroides]
MSSLTLVGTHRAVSELLEARPNSWGVVRFKGLFDRLDKRNQDLSYEMLSLRSTGDVVARAEMGGRQEPDESSLPRYLVAEIDDLIVNPMWLIGGGIGISGRAGAVSPDYRVFRSRGALMPRFIHYLLRSQPYLDQYLLYTRAQTTFDRRVQQPDLDNLPIPVPPLDEQRAIANYLDREISQIDTLIEEQHRLTEMLHERRLAVVERGVALLDWDTPFKTVSTLIQTGPFGSQLKSDEYEDGGIPVINPSHIVAGEVVPDRRIAVSAEKAEQLARHQLEEGDLIAARRGDLGRCAVVTRSAEGFLCGTGSAVVRLDQARLDPSFAALVFSSRRNRDALSLASVGSTMDNLNSDIIGALRIPIPPLDEQRQLTAELKQATAKIDELIAETTRFIELARERRASLITAAVTGQIDVREAT